MGTIETLAFERPERPAPVAAPVADMASAAAALAQAAAALCELVRELREKPASSASHSLTQAPPAGAVRSNCLDPSTVAACVNAFLVAKARAAKSDRYLRAMKNSLSKFARGRSGKVLDDVSVCEIESWLQKSNWNGTTKRGYLRDVRTLYNFAIRRQMASVNTAAVVELPDRAPSTIGIHTPEQVRAVLDAARKTDLNLMRALAVRYFTGIRSAECDRLQEADIRTDTGFIEVRAQNAKTRQRRLLTIRPNLAAWLALGGSLPLHDVGNRMRLFVKACGQPWPHNVTRHSFVSYHLAGFESASKTAMEAGHSEAMLFAHYRALVTPQAAKTFWSIMP